MNSHFPAPLPLMIALAAVLACPTASFAQVKVIMSGGFSAAFEELLPAFEKTTGITVTTTRGPERASRNDERDDDVQF